MPFYRFNGQTVHMRGSKLPKPCSASIGLNTSDGRPMAICAQMSAFLCDGPVGGGHTCDRALCEAHAFEVGKNRHYCPECRADHIDNPAQGGLFTSLVQS